MSFLPDATGYIRHWIVVPETSRPYSGPAGPEGKLRKLERVEPEGLSPPGAELGNHGPYGEVWQFYDPGQNIFVEQSGFWHNLSELDTYGVTRLHVPSAKKLRARFWSCGVGDLWLNESLILRNRATRYMYPDSVDVDLELQVGANELSARVQALGIRDSRFLFGLQILDSTDGLEVQIPASDDINATLSAACQWLDSLQICRTSSIEAGAAPPFPASVRSNGLEQEWADGSSFAIHSELWQVEVTMMLHGQSLSRKFEIPSHRTIRVTTADTVERARKDYIRELADKQGSGRDGVMNVLARHSLGQRSDTDTSIIEEACDWIDERPDCADFPLSALLRLYAGTTLTGDERDRIKRTAIGFRYWQDEPGNDALCFDSENHSLLFHGCQMIAGDLFPEETFTNCCRSGSEHAVIGRERIADWLDKKEAEGFHEFLSSTYIPLTVGALLNVVDFSRDAETSRRSASLIDRLYTVIAEHAFDGITVGPQGRVYRNILTPDASGTQAMLAYTTPQAVHATNGWISFLGASEGYNPPSDLADAMSAPASKTYSEANVEITLEKTADWLLTSLQLPASWQEKPSQVEPPFAAAGLIPGRQGYQQHLWHASLGRDCHVFVNHPGATFDFSSSRPGFWYGNGHLPRTYQNRSVLSQIFNTPDDHPVPFTHAHWPTDAFDESIVEAHWAFGRKGSGCVGLWCSEPLSLKSEVLTDRELRADGRCVAWMCFCNTESDLNTFSQSCKSANPSFDKESLELVSEAMYLSFE